MPKKEFVMRGKTASGETEVLQFSGNKGKGYAYRITEFSLYPSTGIGSTAGELCGTITAGKVALAPTDPNFNDPSLIATTFLRIESQYSAEQPLSITSVNNTFLITQNLILMVQDRSAAGAAVNWQCRFVSEKMSGPEEAATNYKQYAISDESGFHP